jgi:cellulose biosynthesis protein BcsQ
MATIALYNNKGGVGKTTATVNLAYLAATEGRTTLVFDLDPQSSTTYYFRIKPKLRKKARELDHRKPVERSIRGTDFENLDLLPGDFALRNLDNAFNSSKKPQEQLMGALEPFKNEYDLILIDSPPTINIIAENIFRTADALLVPLIPTTLSLRAYEQLLDFMDDFGFNPKAVFAFFSMVDRRKRMHQDLMAEASETYPGILAASIPDLAVIEKMGIERRPLPEYAPRSDAARAYRELWDEVKSVLGL